MTAFVTRITADIATAMREKEAIALSTLRMLKAALMNKEVERGRALDDAESLQVVNALVKQRRDSIEQFRAGGRQDLVDRETGGDRVPRTLPAAGGRATRPSTPRSTRPSPRPARRRPKDMGKVMKAVMARLAGSSVDGRTVSDAVKKRLSG